MRFVALKSEAPHTLQTEHWVRARIICERTTLCNEIRGLLSEFGLVLSVGIRHVRKILSQQEQWNDRFIRLLGGQSEKMQMLDEHIAL